MVLHELASDVGGVEHTSVGEDKDRHLVISRVESSITEPTHVTATAREPRKSKKSKNKKGASDPFADEVDTQDNFGTVADDNENKREEETIKSGSRKQDKKKQQQQPAQSNTKTVNPELDEIDQALKDLGIDNSRCKIKDCTNNVVISRICEFCKYKYCIYHRLPEAHGCGDEAKKKARAEWIQKGTQVVSGATQSKPLTDWERKLLKDKLNKKVCSTIMCMLG